MFNAAGSSTCPGALLAGVFCALASLPASAQTLETPRTDVATEVELVTIQGRVVENVEVAAAANSVSGDTLERFGASTYAEAAAFFPGFQVQEQSPAIPGFVMRGVTTDSGAAFMESRVGLFHDGVPAARNRGAYTELFDLERVEVLRGPQPSLFGRGALTGAVNVIENKASLSETSGSIEAALGSNAYRRALGVFNWAPGKDFAARLSGTMREADGFTEDLAGGEAFGGYHVQAGRAAFAFEPRDDLRFDLIFNVHQDDNPGTAFRSATFAPASGDLSYYAPASLNRSVPGFENGAVLGLSRDVESVSLLGDWRLAPNLRLTSLTGVRRFELADAFDADGAPVPLLFGTERSEGRQFSQELRLVIDGAGPFTGFVGASFLHERSSQRVATAYNEHYFLPLLLGQMHGPASLTQAQADALSFAALTAPTSVGGLGLSAGSANGLLASLASAHSEYYVNSADNESVDVFADMTFALSDRLDLSAGVRYSRDDKTSGLSSGLLNGPSPLGMTLASLFGIPLTGPPGLFIQPQAPIEASGDFDGVSWRVAATYTASQQLDVWASYAHGRTPNVIAMNTGNLPGSRAAVEILPEETMRSFEIGLRAKSVDDSVRLDVSLFDYVYEDFQSTAIVNGTFRSVNAGEAHAFGAEANFNWRVSPEWSVIGAYAYNHARFTAGARDGNQFRLAPDHAAFAGVTYERALASMGGALNVELFYDWRSKLFFDNDNDRRDLQPPLLASVPSLRDRAVDEYQDAYGLLNARVGFTSDRRRWRLGAFIDNALDERYLLDAGNVGDSFTFPTFVRGPARLWGLEVSQRF